jgi:2,5-dihydroxypyridine 5,6-dioxygenase
MPPFTRMALQCASGGRRMLTDRIEAKWIDTFADVFRLCKVEAGEPVAILSETQSRAINVHLAELALMRLGARPFHLVIPSPPQEAPVPVRSTGSSHAIQQLEPVMAALLAVKFVADCTVEGIMHAPETPRLLKAGVRAMYVSNEHPEVLERLKTDPALWPKIQKGREMMQAAGRMRVRSKAGTDLDVVMSGARVGGNFGASFNPGQLSSWPGGICSCFPPKHSVNGVLVLDTGDVNLTFKRYLESPVTLTIEDDFVVDVQGRGLDVELMKSYFEAWGDRNAYGVSHVGWGMNPGARWDALVMYDKGDVNGTELRAFAGNFLYSTGANETAGRYTACHFDIPMRGCTVRLDDRVVVRDGVVQAPLAL